MLISIFMGMVGLIIMILSFSNFLVVLLSFEVMLFSSLLLYLYMDIFYGFKLEMILLFMIVMVLGAVYGLVMLILSFRFMSNDMSMIYFND